MRWLLLATLVAVPAGAQDLGHKALGSLGIDAGAQPAPGLYAADLFLYYQANHARGRDGALLPLRGLDIDVLANSVGVAAVAKFRHAPYLSAGFSLPYARINVSIDDPRVSLDRFGLGDMFVTPIKVGWRLEHTDVVCSYSFYAPTGQFEPRSGSGVGRGEWTHELSFGGALFFDGHRGWRFSALASYDLNSRKREIDITRGDTFQIQGGAGGTLFKLFDVGVAGYALWQVHDDRGNDLPLVLRGARERVFGAGPEVGAMIPPLHARLTARYVWDFSAAARPEGQSFILALSYLAWKP